MLGNPEAGAAVARRQFLGRACLAGSAAAVGLSSASPAARADQSGVCDMSADDWQKLIGERFQVADPSQRGFARLVLTEVCATDHSGETDRPGPCRRASISLLFEFEGARPLEDATAQLSHPALGEFPLLVQQIAPASRRARRRFEAVIN